MSKQENPERTNQAIEIEDLTVVEARQQEVKGGPRTESANNLKQMTLTTTILTDS